MGKNNDNLKDILKVEGVNAKGYGIVPKAVMQDQRLTRDAKAIYCYFASFAGKGDTAFPSVSKICYDLGFKTEETYRKHFKTLKDYDYIRVTQRRISGKFDSNIYILVNNPNPENKDPGSKSPTSPTPKKPGYGKKKLRPSNKPTPKNSGDGENPPSKDQGSNNNSSPENNSSFINNTPQKVVSELKTLLCKYNSYDLSDRDIGNILKKYKDMDKLKAVIEYIKRSEPSNGYKSIVGAIISAANWDINPNRSNENKGNNKTKKHTRFHNFDQRSSGYTAEQLEEMAKRKREQHKRNLDANAKRILEGLISEGDSA